jgi:hypothetical protein
VSTARGLFSFPSKLAAPCRVAPVEVFHPVAAHDERTVMPPTGKSVSLPLSFW